MNTTQIVFASRPQGIPTKDNFRFESEALAALQNGEVLLKGLYYSVDPYMRGRMNEGKSYIPPFQVGRPLEGGVVAEVMESKSTILKTGDLVLGFLPWSQYIHAADNTLQKIDTTLAPASYYLGVLGMPGLTAYVGMILIGKPKAGETVVVSGAAGAVGMIAGQIAKIKGCRVVGIAGSDEKVRLLKEKFGFDEAFNYKTAEDLEKTIGRLCPQGVDIYFDNVGGEISDAVIKHINVHGRIPLCGQISSYNASEKEFGPRWQNILVTRSVLLQEFIILNYQHVTQEAIQHLSKWLKEGKLIFTETIVEGFDQLPRALLGLFSGANTGKMIVHAASPV